MEGCVTGSMLERGQKSSKGNIFFPPSEQVKSNVPLFSNNSSICRSLNANMLVAVIKGTQVCLCLYVIDCRQTCVEFQIFSTDNGCPGLTKVILKSRKCGQEDGDGESVY